jgi:hypothetical protein
VRHLRAALVGTSLFLIFACGLPGAVSSDLGPAIVEAASPSPAPSDATGDTRTSNATPGFIGAPAVAVAAVLALGVTAAVATIAFVRLTGGPGPTTTEDAAPVDRR